MIPSNVAFKVGQWCWHVRHASQCQIIETQDIWGTSAYRVWLPIKNAIIRCLAQDLTSLDSVQPTVDQILYSAAATKLLDALEDNLLLAPIQSSVVPLPHQIYALNRAMSRNRIRYLLADEVGLGKTIEAGLILRELKLRGMVRRVLVVAPKGLVRHTVTGVWSLWEISLCDEGFNRKKFLPIFINDEGRTFVPTAKRIWDLLLTEAIDLNAASNTQDAEHWFDDSFTAARVQGERLFAELLTEHLTRLSEERDRAKYAYDARYQAIGRIGLPAVREHRRKRLDSEFQTRMASLADAEVSVPDMNAVMMLRIDAWRRENEN